MRDRLVIATKGRFPMGDGHNDVGLSRSHLGRALDASLRRLGAADLHLSDEETELLDDASAPLVADYPYGTPGVDQRSRIIG